MSAAPLLEGAAEELLHALVRARARDEVPLSTDIGSPGPWSSLCRWQFDRLAGPEEDFDRDHVVLSHLAYTIPPPHAPRPEHCNVTVRYLLCAGPAHSQANSACIATSIKTRLTIGRNFKDHSIP